MLPGLSYEFWQTVGDGCQLMSQKKKKSDIRIYIHDKQNKKLIIINQFPLTCAIEIHRISSFLDDCEISREPLGGCILYKRDASDKRCRVHQAHLGGVNLGAGS